MDETIAFLSTAAGGGDASASLLDRFAAIVLTQRADRTDQAINQDLWKELVLKYAQAEKELLQLNQLKNKFLGMAAHDLRNPLVAIRGFSEMLLDGGMDEASQKEFLSMIHSASEELLIMLNDLLDVAQIESGKFDLRRSHGDLRQLVRRRIAMAETIAARKDIRITSRLSALPPFLFDPEKIGQAVDNFLSNAIKYSPPASLITVTLARVKSGAKITVNDQGPGIGLEEQSKLFNEFTRLASQPTGGEKSTGLGLAITKKIITSHGGTIGVRSGNGRGCAFYFTLPTEK